MPTDVTRADFSAFAFFNSTDVSERVPLAMKGRFILRGESEFGCVATAMSPNDVVLTASVKPALGEKVILYLSALGRFPGTVTRATEEGFELKLDISKRKRERLTDQLGWFAARLSGGVIERRRHERIVPLVQDTKIYVPDEHAAKIISISITGVGLEASVWPPVGAMVVVGNTPGIVVRHFDEGFACEFIQPFGYDEFDASIQP